MKKLKKFFILLIMLLQLFMLTACQNNRVETYESPNGTNQITIDYDMASRPSVIFNGDTIWEYPGSGFNEDAIFEVTWQTEDTILLKYNDESHDGQYAEEFEIDLK